MSAETLRVQIEQRIARGWNAERICGDLGCSPAAVTAVHALFAVLADEDGPIHIPRLSAYARRVERSRLVAALEQERATVAANVRAKHNRPTTVRSSRPGRPPERAPSVDHELAARRLRHAEWKRQYRARKGTAA